MKQTSHNSRSRTSPADPSPAEKRRTRLLFSAIAAILYVVPCVSCLAFGILSDGMTPAFGVGIAAAVLSIPNAFFVLYAFRVGKYRPLVIAFSAILIALHFVAAPMLGAWYFILSPELLLLALTIAFSGVIGEPKV